MKRIKFTLIKKEVKGDYRPIKWPVKYPYWCAGETEEKYLMVCYSDSAAVMRGLWPESRDLQIEDAKRIEFNEQFPKPSWYIEPVKKSLNPKEIYLDSDMIDLILNIFRFCSIEVCEENNDYNVKFSCSEEEKMSGIDSAIKSLPENNRYCGCTVHDILSLLNEKDGIFYLRFLNYLKNKKSQC